MIVEQKIFDNFMRKQNCLFIRQSFLLAVMFFVEPVGGKTANVFENYDGVDAGATISDQQLTSGNASRIKKRYYEDKINKPLIFMGYAEQEFIIAEGLLRGWVSGDEKTHYENGVKASMEFYCIDEAAANAYLEQPLNKFNNTIEQVIVQKHIAMYMNSNWETFYEQRRTGIPAYNVGPRTYNDMRIPKRWIYPQSEYDYNAQNLAEAVQKQFGGNDDVNELMWILK